MINLSEDEKIIREDELFEVRVAYQSSTTVKFASGSADHEVIASTFEDALVYENLEVFRSYAESGPIRSFKKVIESATTGEDIAASVYETLGKISKAEFALDLLDLDPANSLSPPAYIGSGLAWLQNYLDRTLREAMAGHQETDSPS